MTAPAEALERATAGRRRPLLICYLPVGDPAATAASASVYAEHGVDVVEAGIAVNDPFLDGPEVTASMHRAVAAGVTGRRGARVLADQLAAAGGPASVWMSYSSEPDADYLAMVVASGAGGILLPDAPPVELTGLARAHGVHDVPFLAHDPDPAGRAAASSARTYVMLAAASGVTGVREHVDTGNAEVLARLRQEGITAPVALGFGISGGDHARAAVDLGADGVIVGSACLRAAQQGLGPLRQLLTELRAALDG